MNKDVKDRRALLKGIVAGSAVVGGSKALPEQWSKPLTDSVVLPSHAQTTVDYGDARIFLGDGYNSKDGDYELIVKGDYGSSDDGTNQDSSDYGDVAPFRY